MYLIVDMMSDYREVASHEKVKEFLIDQLLEDLRDNYQEPSLKESMMQILDTLEKLAKYKYTPVKDMEKVLQDYSYKVIDLMQLHRDLYDLSQYTGVTNETQNVLDKINNIIDNGR